MFVIIIVFSGWIKGSKWDAFRTIWEVLQFYSFISHSWTFTKNMILPYTHIHQKNKHAGGWRITATKNFL